MKKSLLAIALGVTLVGSTAMLTPVHAATALKDGNYKVNATIMSIQDDGTIGPNRMIRIAEVDKNTATIRVDDNALTTRFYLQGMSINAAFNGTKEEAAAASTTTSAIKERRTDEYGTEREYCRFDAPIKNIGTQVFSFQSRRGWWQDDFVITPLTPTMKSAKAGKKLVKLTWSNNKTLQTGSQIQYTSGKSISKGKKTSISKVQSKTTVKKLKSKKKYQFRVRTYVKKDGVITYSDWSKVKKVRVR